MSQLINQLVRFVFVGGTATLLDMGILYLLNYQFGVNHFIAATCAFVLATFYNYELSMRFVFLNKNKQAKKTHEMIAFFILSIVGLLLTLLGLFILVDWLRFDVMLAKVIVGVFVMTFNFISRKIYFESQEEG
ncbi:GtrA family protein [Facklamia languida]